MSECKSQEEILNFSLGEKEGKLFKVRLTIYLWRFLPIEIGFKFAMKEIVRDANSGGTTVEFLSVGGDYQVWIQIDVDGISESDTLMTVLVHSTYPQAGWFRKMVSGAIGSVFISGFAGFKPWSQLVHSLEKTSYLQNLAQQLSLHKTGHEVSNFGRSQWSSIASVPNEKEEETHYEIEEVVEEILSDEEKRATPGKEEEEKKDDWRSKC